MYGQRTRSGIDPYYVGKAIKNFKQECFTADKLTKYNECLIKYGGNPEMFFVLLPVRPGRNNNTHIDELEQHLIFNCKRKNQNFMNKNKIKKDIQSIEWCVIRITKNNPSKPSTAATEFKKMMY